MRRFKLPKLRHPWAKSAAGFTLVELVVVIAILGVLAGVGTVGYSGYVKSANKKADITLVGNIIRAVETGIYSNAYSIDEKLQPDSQSGADAAIQIPLGFVLLSEDGAEVLESATEQTTTSVKECVKSGSEIDVYSVKYYQAPSTHLTSGYYLVKESYYYCTTHSETPVKTTIADLKTRLNATAIYNTGGYEATVLISKYKDNQEFNIKGDFSCFECGDSASSGTNHYKGKTFNAVNTYSGNFVAADAEASGMTQVLKAAFGEDLTASTALKYKDWKTDGSIPTFYTGGTQLWNKVESLGNKLVPYSGIDIGGKKVTTNTYTSSEQLVDSFASKMITTYSDAEDFYTKAWKPVDDSTDNTIGGGLYCESYGFGFNEREFYCACRVAYNEAFASYVESHTPTEHTHTATTCANNIRAYGEFMFVATLPKLVCRSALKTYGEDDGSGDLNCAACLELYDKYVSSGTSKANAIAFYNTMDTVEATADMASGTALGFFDYYNAYLKEFEGLYGALKDLTADKETAIIIAFYYRNGLVDYEVLPVDANPRKD